MYPWQGSLLSSVQCFQNYQHTKCSRPCGGDRVGKICSCLWKHVSGLWTGLKSVRLETRLKAAALGLVTKSQPRTAPLPGPDKIAGPLIGGRQERTDRSLLAFFMKGGGGVEAKARTRENTLWTGRTIIPHVCPDPPAQGCHGQWWRQMQGSASGPGLLSALTWLWLGPHRLGFLSSPKTLFHPFSAPTLWGGQPTISTQLFKTPCLSGTLPLFGLGLEGDFGQSRITERPCFVS